VSECIDIEKVGFVMAALLSKAGRPVVLEDLVGGTARHVPASSAAAADGLLPVFLVAGEALWREATGDGFAIEIESDLDALCGYRVTKIGAGQFVSVMLSMMEAAFQAARPEGIMVNEITLVWHEATRRAEQRAISRPRAPEGEMAS
jgi:hypothetical protein